MVPFVWILLFTLIGPIRCATINDIKNVIIIYLENFSFDGLFGDFPGAIGLGTAPSSAITQVDANDVPYSTLPTKISQMPNDLPNKPFDATSYFPRDVHTPDLSHTFYIHQKQLNFQNGVYKMNKFVLNNVMNSPKGEDGFTMSYYPIKQSPLYPYIYNYTLLDNYFQGMFGGSWPNANFLISARPAVYNVSGGSYLPPSFVNTLDPNTGFPAFGVDNKLTPDGYFVNNLDSIQFYPKYEEQDAKNGLLVPPQEQPTIGDRMDAKGVTWTWFAEGWDLVKAGNASSSFDWHHHPFVYYKNYAPNTTRGESHHADLKVLQQCLQTGKNLPQVSFVKFDDAANAHPKSSSLSLAEASVQSLLDMTMSSSYWNNVAVFVTYDEYGGRWDHVPPPKIDRWGPGNRVGLYVISPFARRQFVDSTFTETTSIQKFLNLRFGLDPLPGVRAQSGDLTSAFNFDPSSKNHSPRSFSSVNFVWGIVVAMIVMILF